MSADNQPNARVVRLDTGEVRDGARQGLTIGRAEVVPVDAEELDAARHVVAAARAMRESQRAYFSHKSEAALKAAKAAESKFDSVLRAYDKLTKSKSGDTLEQAGLL